VRVAFIPKTSLGKWSVRLILIFFVSLATFSLLVASGQRGGETFFSNQLLTFPILTAGATGVAAFFSGIISILKQKERAILVFVAAAIGLFVIYFALGEILFPH
jgi:cytochrome bd-type quinol oxidase subunit 2